MATHLAALLFTVFVLTSPAAYAGPFGEGGYDPSLMLSWASAVDDFERGPLDIADPGLGNASHGLPEDALGAASGDPADVFSLGDGGFLTLFFDPAIADGPGDDFAVYENGFFTIEGLFAEFAFAEVSSDGVDFARFDAVSLHATAVPAFGAVDPSDFNNLAGDQPIDLGTGFDLAELASHPLVVGGQIDLSDIAYVRLVDVIGDGSTLDSLAQPIFDPYATPFPTGGFDVEAVGALHVPEPGRRIAQIAGIVWLALLARFTPCHTCKRNA